MDLSVNCGCEVEKTSRCVKREREGVDVRVRDVNLGGEKGSNIKRRNKKWRRHKRLRKRKKGINVTRHAMLVSCKIAML